MSRLQLRLDIEGELRIRVEASSITKDELRKLEFIVLSLPYIREQVVEFSLSEIKRLENRQIVDSIRKIVSYEGPTLQNPDGLVVVELDRALGANYY